MSRHGRSISMIMMAGVVVAAGTLTSAPADAALPSAAAHQSSALAKRAPLPPVGAAHYRGLKVTCTNHGNYVTISSTPTSYVTKVPKKRKVRDIGLIYYYQQITLRLQSPAGYNGTMWKTLAKKKFTQKTYRIPPKKNKRYLPSAAWATVQYNARYGSGDYRVEMEVKLKRDFAGVPDSTAWTYKVASATRSCVTVS